MFMACGRGAGVGTARPLRKRFSKVDCGVRREGESYVRSLDRASRSLAGFCLRGLVGGGSVTFFISFPVQVKRGEELTILLASGGSHFSPTAMFELTM